MTMLNKYPDVLNVKQLCEVLDIGKNTAYKLLKSGNIKALKQQLENQDIDLVMRSLSRLT